MAHAVIQPNFAAGELTASLYARVDLQKYHAGLALSRNFFIDYHGGASNRPGTKFVGRCLSNAYAKNRLIPFNFNNTQTYALVFGHLTLRVVKNGGWVLEAAKNLTGMTNANPGVFTSATHGFSNGDEIYLLGTGPLSTLNGKNLYVQTAAANTFTLTDLWGNVIDTTALGAYSSGGTVARIYTQTTPYNAYDLDLLKYSQSADVMTLTHTGYTPYNLTRSGDAAWTFSAITFAPGTSAPGGAPTVTKSAGGGTTYNYVITAIGANGISESTPSAVGTVTAAAAMSQTVGAFNTIDWTAHTVTGATGYNVYRQSEVIGGNAEPSQLYGFVGSVLSTTAKFIDQNITPDFTKCPPLANNPFTGSNNPACSTYYQQRQCYGGLVNGPDNLVFSQSGDFTNMDYASPSRDSDEIEISLASLQVNAIKHLMPMNSLIALTASGAWKIDGGTLGASITPTTVQATPQAYVGCSDVPPLLINYDILYVQAKGSIVRDLSYNFYVNIYTGADISVLASHLFRNHQITDWAWAQEPFKIVWCVRDDGKLLALTYLKEQEVFGWTRHDTNGRFKSVCSISEGQEDAVYFIVERYINGQWVQYVERMASRLLNSDPTIGIPADLSLAWFVDCGLQWPLGYPAATLYPVVTDLTQDPVTGFWSGTSLISAVSVDDGGSGYTAPIISIADTTGSGAVLTPVVVSGVITGVTVTSAGSNYTNPVLTIIDATGSGGAVSAQIQRPVRFNANSAVFSAADLGKVLRLNGGLGPVIARTTTQITVDLQYPLNAIWPAAANGWSLTTPTNTVSGLDHLEGMTVVGLVDGNVQPAQVVTHGTITFPDTGTAIVWGISYQAQLQSLYLDIGEPSVQGKRKQLPSITLRVADTRGLKVGSSFDSLQEFNERTTQLFGQPIQCITGDERVNMNSAWTTQGQVCVQQDNPLPCTVLGFIPEVVIGDTAQ